MITRYTHKNLVWVDLESPTQNEVREIMAEFHINPLAADELLTPTLRPKVDVYENFIYMILHFPAAKHTHNGSENSQEVDFMVGKNFLITTRYDTVDPIHKFSKVFEVNSILDRGDIGSHGGYLIFYMIRKLYRAVGHELENIESSLDDIEEQIFSDKEHKMVKEITIVTRKLLNFKQAMAAHKDILSSFEVAGKQFFFYLFLYHLRSMIGEYYKVENELKFHFETATELRETNNSLLSTKQNEIMKVLTIMTFVALPLTLIASVFGMNTNFIPVVGHQYDFFIIIGIMAATAAVLFGYFKYRKWL
jgi:magnesium transporter